jgi:hypothetical protein
MHEWFRVRCCARGRDTLCTQQGRLCALCAWRRRRADRGDCRSASISSLPLFPLCVRSFRLPAAVGLSSPLASLRAFFPFPPWRREPKGVSQGERERARERGGEKAAQGEGKGRTEGEGNGRRWQMDGLIGCALFARCRFQFIPAPRLLRPLFRARCLFKHPPPPAQAGRWQFQQQHRTTCRHSPMV